MSTNNGLCMFDPKTEVFKNYNERDGLQSNEFNGGSFSKSKSGEMFFGGINGFNAFYTGAIEDNRHIPPVVITSFRKFNKEVKLGSPICELTELKLSHRDYVFSFEFAALEYTAPDKNRYAYKMEGLDKDWNYTDSRRRYANYTTLPPGDYVFRVKASNNDGVWNEEGACLQITITPPFWKTWLFRAVSAILVAGLAAILYGRRLQNVRMKVELQSAHNAQMSIMPQNDPMVEGFDISGACIPANEVGGDFYDYIWLNENCAKFGIVVGDVSGKAMQAAMYAIMSSGMVNLKAFESSSTKDIVTRLNRPLYFKTQDTIFTALCLLSIDTQTKELTFTNAGINNPLLKSNGSIAPLEATGKRFPLGAFRDTIYEEKEHQLKSGDVVVIYTDGINEAYNEIDEFYETRSLVNLLKRLDTSGMSAKEIKGKIIDDVRRFSGKTKQNDDMTIIVVKVG